MRHTKRCNITTARQESNLQCKRAAAQRVREATIGNAMAQKHSGAAVVIQGGIRGYSARKSTAQTLLALEKEEAETKRKLQVELEKRRLTEEDQAARIRLIEHREQIRTQREAAADKQMYQINKFALAWAQAEAVSITDKAKQEAMQARLESLQSAINVEEQKAPVQLPDTDEIVQRLHAEKQEELISALETENANDHTVAAADRADELAAFGELANMDTSSIHQELESGKKLPNVKLSSSKATDPEQNVDNSPADIVDSIVRGEVDTAFEKLDINHDGVLTREEFGQGLRPSGQENVSSTIDSKMAHQNPPDEENSGFPLFGMPSMSMPSMSIPGMGFMSTKAGEPENSTETNATLEAVAAKLEAELEASKAKIQELEQKTVAAEKAAGLEAELQASKAKLQALEQNGTTGTTSAVKELENELRTAKLYIEQLQTNVEVAQGVIHSMDAKVQLPIPVSAPVQSFDELITRLRTESDIPMAAKKVCVHEASSKQTCTLEIAQEIISHFKGRDLEDVAFELHQALSSTDFEQLVSHIRPKMYQRRILQRIAAPTPR